MGWRGLVRLLDCLEGEKGGCESLGEAEWVEDQMVGGDVEVR